MRIRTILTKQSSCNEFGMGLMTLVLIDRIANLFYQFAIFSGDTKLATFYRKFITQNYPNVKYVLICLAIFITYKRLPFGGMKVLSLVYGGAVYFYYVKMSKFSLLSQYPFAQPFSLLFIIIMTIFLFSNVIENSDLKSEKNRKGENGSPHFYD